VRCSRKTIVRNVVVSVLVLGAQTTAPTTAMATTSWRSALISEAAAVAAPSGPVPTPFALLSLNQPGGTANVTSTLAVSSSSPAACSAGSPPANQQATTTISEASDSSSLASLTFMSSSGGGIAFQGPVLETASRTLQLNLTGDSGADVMTLTGYGTTFTGPGSVTSGPCSFAGTVTLTLPGTGFTLAPVTLTLVDAASGVPFVPNDQECNPLVTAYKNTSGLTCAAFDPTRKRDVMVGDRVEAMGTGFNPWAGSVSVSFDGMATVTTSASLTGKFQATFTVDEPAANCAAFVQAKQFNAMQKVPLVLTYEAQVWDVVGTVQLPHFTKPLVTGQGICEQPLPLYNLLSPEVATGAGVVVVPFDPGAVDDTAAGGTAVPGGRTGWDGWVATGRWNPYSGRDIVVISRPPGEKPITFVATIVVNSLSIELPGGYFNDSYNLYEDQSVLDPFTAKQNPRFDDMANVEAHVGVCAPTSEENAESTGRVVLVNPPECYFTPDGEFAKGLTLSGGRLMYLFSADHALDVHGGMSVAGDVAVQAASSGQSALQAIVIKGGLQAVGGGWDNASTLVLSGRALVVKG
jgi:hypothetical protein